MTAAGPLEGDAKLGDCLGATSMPLSTWRFRGRLRDALPGRAGQLFSLTSISGATRSPHGTFAQCSSGRVSDKISFVRDEWFSYQRLHLVLVSFAMLAITACPSALGQVPVQQPDQGARITVRILSPNDGEIIRKAEVRLQVAVRAAKVGELIELRTYIDGKPSPAASSDPGSSAQGLTRDIVVDRTPIVPAAPAPGEELRTLALRVPASDCAVAVEAIESGRASERVTVHLRWGGKTASFTTKPDLYGLLIGVSDYSYSESLPLLRYAAKDARDLRQALAAQSLIAPNQRLYGKIELRVLQDREATRERIVQELEALQRQSTPNDVILVFLAGHAINHRSTGDYYFVPYGGNPAEPEASLLPGSQLLRILRDITGKSILLLDTCHAGAISTGAQARGGLDIDQFVSELQSVDSGLIVYTATTGRQLAKEYDQIENGVFTHALIEGLRGEAASERPGPISVNSLSSWLSRRVKTLTNGEQTPVMKNPNELPDFAIAVVEPLPPLRVLSSRMPVHKRWWFWTALGAAAVAISTSIVVTTQYAYWPSFPARLSDGARGEIRF